MTTIPTEQLWLTRAQAAKRAGVTVDTIDEWRRRGLRSARVGRMIRIRADWLEEFLKGLEE